MKLSTPLCPTCGEPAIGTYDKIPGIALFGDEPDENGEVHFCDQTELDWSGQRTTRGETGKPRVTCDNGHLWESEIEGLEGEEDGY